MGPHRIGRIWSVVDHIVAVVAIVAVRHMIGAGIVGPDNAVHILAVRGPCCILGRVVGMQIVPGHSSFAPVVDSLAIPIDNGMGFDRRMRNPRRSCRHIFHFHRPLVVVVVAVVVVAVRKRLVIEIEESHTIGHHMSYRAKMLTMSYREIVSGRMRRPMVIGCRIRSPPVEWRLGR